MVVCISEREKEREIESKFDLEWEIVVVCRCDVYLFNLTSMNTCWWPRRWSKYEITLLFASLHFSVSAPLELISNLCFAGRLRHCIYSKPKQGFKIKLVFIQCKCSSSATNSSFFLLYLKSTLFWKAENFDSEEFRDHFFRFNLVFFFNRNRILSYLRSFFLSVGSVLLRKTWKKNVCFRIPVFRF